MKKLFCFFIALALLVGAAGNQAVVAHGKLQDIHGHWAEEDINSLVEKGVISGYDDGTFRPNQQITRAEFTKLFVHTFMLNDVAYSPNYVDVKGHWAKKEISIASGHGIISGKGYQHFAPNDLLTREELSVFLYRLFVSDSRMPIPKEEARVQAAQLLFTDEDDVSIWAKDSVHLLAGMELVTGFEDGTFRPKKETTRAEAVTMLSRTLEKLSSEVAIYKGDYQSLLLRGIPTAVKEWLDNNHSDEGSLIWTDEVDTYVVVSRGAVPHPGYGISVKDITEQDEKTIVHISYHEPHPEYSYPTVIAYPVVVVKLPGVTDVEMEIE